MRDRDAEMVTGIFKILKILQQMVVEVLFCLVINIILVMIMHYTNYGMVNDIHCHVALLVI